METNIVFNRKNELDKEGKGLIEIQIYLSRTKRPCRSTGVRVNPKFWDSKKKCVKKSHENSDFLNSQIFNFKLEIEKNLLLDQIDYLSNKKSKIEISTDKLNLQGLIQSYITELKHSKKAKSTTIQNHEIKLKNLILFESKTKQTYNAENFNCVTAERFKEWFQTAKNTQNVTSASRNVVFFRLVLSWAQKKGKIGNFPLHQYQGERDKVKEPVYLNQAEFMRLLNANFENNYLNKIKDLFIFQCVTGLSYGDIWSKFEIMLSNGKKVIQGKRSKNNQAFFLPLSPIAENILEKYNFALPVYCNAVYNRILKEICACVGIEKKISTHTARKTFATLQSEKGWSVDSIAQMLGHASTKTTEVYYLGKSFVRIENEMQKIG